MPFLFSPEARRNIYLLQVTTPIRDTCRDGGVISSHLIFILGYERVRVYIYLYIYITGQALIIDG